MWQEYTNPIPYQLTAQEPPLAEFLDGSTVIVMIEKEGQALRIYPFPTLESEKRDLVKSADAGKLLSQLRIPQHAPDLYGALIAGTGVLYVKIGAGAVTDVFTPAR